MKNQRLNQVKTKESINNEVGKTVTTKYKVEIIKIILRKEDKIQTKVISEAIEETTKNNEMMKVTLNKNQIKIIKETKENNKEVKIIKKNLMKVSLKIINKIQTIIKEEASNIHKMSDNKMELLNNNNIENTKKIINRIVMNNIKDLRQPKIVEVIKIRSILLIRKKILISKVDLFEVEVVIRQTSMNRIVEEETIEELEEEAIEMTLFVIKLTKMPSIQRKILLNNVKNQMILISRTQTMVKETKILKEILTKLIVVEVVEEDEVKMFRIVVVGHTIKRIMQLVKPGSIINSFRNPNE